jgi:hypothetical protein
MTETVKIYSIRQWRYYSSNSCKVSPANERETELVLKEVPELVYDNYWNDYDIIIIGAIIDSIFYNSWLSLERKKIVDE